MRLGVGEGGGGIFTVDYMVHEITRVYTVICWSIETKYSQNSTNGHFP